MKEEIVKELRDAAQEADAWAQLEEARPDQTHLDRCACWCYRRCAAMLRDRAKAIEEGHR